MPKAHRIFAFLCFATSATAAQTAIQTLSVGQTNEPFDTILAFNRFDPILGTLTGIEVSLFVQAPGSATVSNNSFSQGNYSYTNASDLFLSDLGGLVFYDEALPISATQTGSISPNASQNLNATASSSATAVFHGVGAGPFSLTSYDGTGSPSDPIDSTPFIGTGTLNLVLSGRDNSSCTGTNISCLENALGGGTVTLVYDFTPSNITVPEPAGATLLGSALLTLAWVKLRGRKNRSTVIR